MRSCKRFFVFLIVFSFFYPLEIVYSNNGDKGGVLLIVEEDLKEPFTLHSYKLFIDGKEVYKFEGKKSNGIHIRQLSTGRHTATIKAEYAGTGYGLFSYHSDYIYPVKGDYEFHVKKDRISTLRVICSDRGGFLSDLKKRPYVEFELEELSSPDVEKFITAPAAEILRASKREPAEAKPQLNSAVKQIKLNDFSEKDIKLLPAHVLRQIYIEGGDYGLNVILDGDGVFDDFNSFVLSDPPRIVVDLIGVNMFKGNSVLPVNKNILKEIRLGKHENKVRVVLDLKSSSFFDIIEDGNKLKIVMH